MQRYMWQRLIESSNDVVCVHSHKGVYEYVSPSVHKVLRHRAPDLIGKTIQHLAHPADLKRVQRTLSRLIQKPNGRHIISYRVRTGSGTYLWVEANCSTVKTRNERPHIMCIVRDVHKRKRAERQVHRRTEKLDALVSMPKTLMWLSDETGRRMQFNEAWMRFTGRELLQEQGNGWLAHVHGKDRERCKRVTAQHMRSLQPYEHEYRIRHRDGSYRWLRELAVPRFSDQATFAGYQGSCFDVTDTKEVVIKMRRKTEELARLKFALDRLTDHIVIADASGTIIYANEAATRMTGYSTEEMIGKKHGSSELWGGNMTADFYEQLWATAKKRSEVFEGYVLNRRKSGEFYGALLRIHPISTKAGGVKYFAAFENEVPVAHIDTRTIASDQRAIWDVRPQAHKRTRRKR